MTATFASHTPEKRGGRGQVFTWDLIFSAVMFLLVFFMIIYLWDSIALDIVGDLTRYEMKWLASSVAEQLVRTPGFPENWNTNNVETYGLADVLTVGGYTIPEDRVIDPDKLLFFLMNVDGNYTEVRRSLLGSSRYDFYVIVSCLNTSQLDCLQNLHLDSVNIPVNCVNGFNLTVRNHTTDTVIWLEAEDPALWGYNTTSNCERGCSGGSMSMIDMNGRTGKTVETNPGSYTVWVRGLSNSKALQFVADGTPTNVFSESRHVVEWSRIGDFAFESFVNLSFDNTDSASMIDAILLTTDPFYDPRTTNKEYYGNPNHFTECIVGNYSLSEDVTDFVGSVKTATFSEPMDELTLLTGKQRMLKKTFKLDFVVWGIGEYGGIETTTTTTTLSARINPMSCTGKPQPNCIDASNPIVVIDRINTSGPLQCGGSVDVAVSWHGQHRGDFNHWGFFLDDGSHFLDACNSTNGTTEAPGMAYRYDMSFTLNIPSDFDATDGFHELIVTAEDYLGYCPPEDDEFADAVYRMPVTITGCIQYTPLTGVGPMSDLKTKCIPLDTIEKVYWIQPGREPATCGDVINISVYWGGTHGIDDSTYWAFFLDNGTGYVLLDACKTSQPDAIKSYYNMTCEVRFDNPLLASIPAGKQRLLVTGETDLGYCNKISEADVVEAAAIDWTPCS